MRSSASYFSFLNSFWQKHPGVWCRIHVASVVCNLVQFAMYPKMSCTIVERLDGHCKRVLELRKFLRMHGNLGQLKGRNCWNKMAFVLLMYVPTFTVDPLFLTARRMPLWQYASQIHIALYPGMGCMLMTTDLEESTSGQPSKTTSNRMGELDQQKLILSMQHLFYRNTIHCWYPSSL